MLSFKKHLASLGKVITDVQRPAADETPPEPRPAQTAHDELRPLMEALNPLVAHAIQQRKQNT